MSNLALASNNGLTARKPFIFYPATLEEAEKYAEKIVNSSFCPSSYKGKPGDALIAIMMGAEVGLPAIQALQNIAVINGRPTIWGDAALALVRNHPYCESVQEWMEGSIENGDAKAFCAIKRKGQEVQVTSFDIIKAKKAGLWNKQGPWQQYPYRMLQMRARGFCMRDVFPDALKGMYIHEEAMDMENITPAGYKNGEVLRPTKEVDPLDAALGLTQEEEPVEADFNEQTGEIIEPETASTESSKDDILAKINNAKSSDDLVTVIDLINNSNVLDNPAKAEVMKQLRERKKQIDSA